MKRTLVSSSNPIPVTTFYLPSDVWRLIIANLDDKKTLFYLLLTCHTFTRLTNLVHWDRLDDWRKTHEEARMVTKLNERIKGYNRCWFICHTCNRLFICASPNEMNELAILSNDTNTALFCSECTLSCDGCGQQYCLDMAYEHDDCLF